MQTLAFHRLVRRAPRLWGRVFGEMLFLSAYVPSRCVPPARMPARGSAAAGRGSSPRRLADGAAPWRSAGTADSAGRSRPWQPPRLRTKGVEKGWEMKWRVLAPDRGFSLAGLKGWFWGQPHDVPTAAVDFISYNRSSARWGPSWDCSIWQGALWDPHKSTKEYPPEQSGSHVTEEPSWPRTGWN